MSKKSRANKAAKAAAAATTSATPTPGLTPDLAADRAGKTVDAHSALPARPIVNSVKGTGASATFKGVGTMAALGIGPGKRRNEFQDAVLEWNETSKTHLTDDELAQIFDAEFPLGGVRIVDRPELVAVIRKFYNAGKHGKQQGGNIPTVQSMSYGKPKSKTTPAADADATDDPTELAQSKTA